jgi:hypothetical protein
MTNNDLTNDLTFPQWGAALGQWGEDLEHDDLMTADDYDRRRWERDGWNDRY